METQLLVSLLIYVVFLGLIFYVLWWGLSQMALPDPFDKIARGVIIVIVVIVLINILLGLTGHMPFKLR